MSESTLTIRRTRLRPAAQFLLALLFSSMLTTWAWDAIAVELLQAPAIRFKQALAFNAALAAIAFVLVSVARGGAARAQRRPSAVS